MAKGQSPREVQRVLSVLRIDRNIAVSQEANNCILDSMKGEETGASLSSGGNPGAGNSNRADDRASNHNAPLAPKSFEGHSNLLKGLKEGVDEGLLTVEARVTRHDGTSAVSSSGVSRKRGAR